MRKILFFTGLSVFFFTAFSQEKEVEQSFRPVFMAGLVTSQVDGDTYDGYHKIGYYFGLGINRQLTKRTELEFGITFLQKGARKNYALDSASRNNPNNQFYLIRLNYVEVPLVFRFTYKKFKFEGGAAFAYLIKNPPHEESQNGYYSDKQIKNFDYSYILGLGYKLKPNVLINLRYEYSFVPFRDYYQSTAGIYHGQFPYSLFNTGLYNNLFTLSYNYKFPVKAVTPVEK
jgi:opacity protein-like surface antigen